MNHSASFRAAGSLIAFSAAVASDVLALRARSIALLTAARSPESGGVSAIGVESWRGCFVLLCSAACFPRPPFLTAALRCWRVPLASCDFLACCGLWLARAAASGEQRARAAIVNRHDSG